MYLLRKFIDSLVYSNIFIGICAVALTLTNQLSVESAIRFDKSLCFVFFSTVFAYSLLKFRNTSDITYTTHHRWAADNSQLSKNILLISLIASGLFFFQLENKVKLTVAILAAFTAFYGFIDIPFTQPKRKLRDFGLLKTLFVAVVWSVTTLMVPLGDAYIENDMMIFLLVRRFLFILALTIPFEIKDMSGDKEHNLKTISLTFGVSNTKLISQGILFLLMIILTVQYFLFDVSLLNILAINFSLLISIFCIQPIKEETKDWWYYVVLDGMMILQFVFVYATTKYL